MGRSEPRMNTAIGFVEHLDGFSAQGEESFIRRQGHGSVLRRRSLLSTTDATRRRDILRKTASPAPTAMSRGAAMEPYARSRPATDIPTL